MFTIYDVLELETDFCVSTCQLKQNCYRRMGLGGGGNQDVVKMGNGCKSPTTTTVEDEWNQQYL
jgi:hypothetical protein